MRDNTSLNNTLISSFIKAYDIEGIKFKGDITYSTYILNLVTQDILRVIIDNTQNLEQEINVIKSIELGEDKDIEISSKFLLL